MLKTDHLLSNLPITRFSVNNNAIGKAKDGSEFRKRGVFMHIQKINSPSGSDLSYSIVDDNGIPFPPATAYFKWFGNAGKSQSTLRYYASYLTIYLNYLAVKDIDWRSVRAGNLIDFVQFLQFPNPGNWQVGIHAKLNSPRRTPKPKRAASTINTILSAVASFYRYHQLLGNIEPPAICAKNDPSAWFIDSFADRFVKNDQTHNRVRLKLSKKIPKTISAGDFAALVSACKSIRDQLLIAVIYECGLTIKEVLALRHHDFFVYDNEICVRCTRNSASHLAEVNDSRLIHVSMELMKFYINYVIEEFADTQSDYVFVELWSNPVGRSMRYHSVSYLFQQLKNKTGINVTPRILRHTHATDFVSACGRLDVAQARLGHQSIITTIKAYGHADLQEMKRACSIKNKGDE